MRAIFNNATRVRLRTSILPFLELPLPLAFPLPAPNRTLMGGIICDGGGIRRGHGRMGGPRGNPEPRGTIDGTIGAMPRALGPPGNLGSIPLGRDAPLAGLSGSGNLCRGPNIGFNGGGSIRGGITCGVGLPTNLGGGSGGCRTPAGGNLGPMRGPLFSGLILIPGPNLFC